MKVFYDKDADLTSSVARLAGAGGVLWMQRHLGATFKQ
jgi:hypothetical protein